MSVRVGVVDYGAGNVGSILNMLARVGADGAVVGTPEALQDVDRVILPGVGHFDHGVSQLRASGMFDALQLLDTRSIPLLGVCLGMQLLLDGSEEGTASGLGLIPGHSRRFDPGDTGRKVPHMGWNTVTAQRSPACLAGQVADSRFYFVHSYYVVPDDPAHVAGTTHYITRFCSAVDRGDGVAGYQFHPEKSHRFGMALLRSFAEQS